MEAARKAYEGIRTFQAALNAEAAKELRQTVRRYRENFL